MKLEHCYYPCAQTPNQTLLHPRHLSQPHHTKVIKVCLEPPKLLPCSLSCVISYPFDSELCSDSLRDVLSHKHFHEIDIHSELREVSMTMLYAVS